MKKLTVGLFVASFLGSVVNSLEITIGGGPQQEQFRGWIQYKGDKVDLKSDLHIKDKILGSGYIKIKHKAKLGFVPIPDIKISYLNVKSSGLGKVSKSFKFGFLTINLNDKVYSKFKFDQWDITFFYTPLKKRLLKTSWGVGTKIIDFYGYVRSETTGKSDSKSAILPLPYIYLAVKSKWKFVNFDLTLKGLTVGGNNYFYDAKGTVGLFYALSSRINIGAEGGYRYQKYRVDNVSNISANLRVKGGFGNIVLRIQF